MQQLTSILNDEQIAFLQEVDREHKVAIRLCGIDPEPMITKLFEIIDKIATAYSDCLKDRDDWKEWCEENGIARTIGKRTRKVITPEMAKKMPCPFPPETDL